jgi:hypothetical protein
MRVGAPWPSSTNTLVPMHARYPTMVEMAASYFLRPGYDFADEFDFGLDLILDGWNNAKVTLRPRNLPPFRTHSRLTHSDRSTAPADVVRGSSQVPRTGRLGAHGIAVITGEGHRQTAHPERNSPRGNDQRHG